MQHLMALKLIFAIDFCYFTFRLCIFYSSNANAIHLPINLAYDEMVGYCIICLCM